MAGLKINKYNLSELKISSVLKSNYRIREIKATMCVGNGPRQTACHT
jgi:hypothetical protein